MALGVVHVFAEVTYIPQCMTKAWVRIGRDVDPELEKKRAYDQRVREIEHGSFSPLVFSTTGGMGTTATVVYRRLASLISEKYGKPYNKSMQWIRCRLSYSLLRSAIMCLRGSRSSRHHPVHHPISGGSIDLAAQWAGSQIRNEQSHKTHDLSIYLFIYVLLTCCIFDACIVVCYSMYIMLDPD